MESTTNFGSHSHAIQYTSTVRCVIRDMDPLHASSKSLEASRSEPKATYRTTQHTNLLFNYKRYLLGAISLE